MFLPVCLLMTNCLQIEKELESVLTMWENDHERYFVVKDSRYLDTVKNQWEEKNEQKEKEKMQRVGQMVLVSHCIHTAEGGSNGVGFSLYPHCKLATLLVLFSGPSGFGE